MKKCICLVVCIVSLFMISCNSVILPIYMPAKDPKIPENNIVKEIPRYENGKMFVFYKYAKQKQEQLKLTAPENGYDGLLLRFWFTYPDTFDQYAEKVEIRQNPNNEIEADYTRMSILFNPYRDKEKINSSVDTIISTPINGWDNFLDTLNRLDIVNLPTIEDIPLYIDRGGRENYGNDYLVVVCEIATKDKYRFIQYNDFEKHKDIDEVNRMFRFIRFLRSEFKMVDISDEWYGSGE